VTQVALREEPIESHQVRKPPPPPPEEDRAIPAAGAVEESPAELPSVVADGPEDAKPSLPLVQGSVPEPGRPELVAPADLDLEPSDGPGLRGPDSESDRPPPDTAVETPAPEPRPAEEPAAVRPPALRLGLPEALDLIPGEKTTVPIRIARDGASGPVAIAMDELPAGVTASTPTIAADADRGEVVLSASPSAPEVEGVLRVVGSAEGASAEAEVRYVVHAAPALAHARRGNAHFEEKNYDRAIAAYSEAIRLDPSDPVTFNNRGLAYRERGRYHKAIADYNEALRLRPRDAVVSYNRGMAYYHLGDTIGAIADFTRALELRPDYAQAYRRRGEAHARRGQAEQAKADQDEAERLDALPRRPGATRVRSHGSRAG
jgi:Tfp pilus assembly protein PilF